MFESIDFIPILQIIWIDLLLSGDNAVVIALACRGLPEKQKRIKRMVCQESMDLLSLRGWELIADGSVNSADELAKELRSLHDSVFQTSTLRTLDGWVKWGRINELKGTLYWVLRTVIYFNMSLTTLATVSTPMQ